MTTEIIYTSLKDITRSGGQEPLTEISLTRRQECFHLERNYHDPQNVFVCGSLHDQVYGFVKRRAASQVVKCLDYGGSAEITGYRIGGSSRHHTLAVCIELTYVG